MSWNKRQAILRQRKARALSHRRAPLYRTIAKWHTLLAQWEADMARSTGRGVWP